MADIIDTPSSRRCSLVSSASSSSTDNEDMSIPSRAITNDNNDCELLSLRSSTITGSCTFDDDPELYSCRSVIHLTRIDMNDENGAVEVCLDLLHMLDRKDKMEGFSDGEVSSIPSFRVNRLIKVKDTTSCDFTPVKTRDDLRPMNALLDTDDCCTSTPIATNVTDCNTITTAETSSTQSSYASYTTPYKLGRSSPTSDTRPTSTLFCGDDNSGAMQGWCSLTDQDYDCGENLYPTTIVPSPSSIHQLCSAAEVEGTINHSLGMTEDEDSNLQNSDDCCKAWQFWMLCPDGDGSTGSSSGICTYVQHNRNSYGILDTKPNSHLNSSIHSVSNTVPRDDGIDSESDKWVNVQRSLRSRAYDTTLRRNRIDSLKRQLYPFNPTTSMDLQNTNALSIMKSRSLGINKNLPATSLLPIYSTSKPTDHKPEIDIKRKEQQLVSVLNLGSVLECGSMHCITSTTTVSPDYEQHYNSPASIRMAQQRECMDKGYDSDPEDMIRRNTKKSAVLLFGAQSQKSMCIQKGNATNSFNRNNRDCVETVGRYGSDERVMSRLVHDFINKRSTMLLHRDDTKITSHFSSLPVSSKSTTVAVHVWVELGYRLRDNTVLLPKLVWMPVAKLQEMGRQLRSRCSDDNDIHFGNNSGAVTGSTSKSAVRNQRDETSSVELLDISRVLHGTKKIINSTQYPFVRIANTFLIRTMQKQDIIFEASSEQERNHFVSTLKHVVARFASKILLQDESVALEFFHNNHNNQYYRQMNHATNIKTGSGIDNGSSYVGCGPGECPSWLLKPTTKTNTAKAPPSRTQYQY